MQSNMMDRPLMLDHLVERAGQLFPTVEVVSQMPDKSLRRHTYRDVLRRVRSLAAGLRRAGLREGDRVATLMWNHHAHLEAYFGVPMAGGIYHTLNLRLAPEELAYIVNHAQDRFLIVDDVLLPLLERFAPEVKLEKVFVVQLAGKGTGGHEDYEALIDGGSDGFEPPPPDEKRAAGLCYTSGTTGHPKGVSYSHRALVLHTFASIMKDTLSVGQEDVVLPVVPQFHANAWGMPFACTMVGCKQVFPGPHLDPESLLDLYEKERVTLSAGVPTIWFGIQQALEKEPSRWKLTPNMRMVVGGSAAPEAMIRKFDELGMQVIHAWGMTETTPLGSISTLKATLADADEATKYRVRAKQGIAVPFVEMRVMGDEGPVPWDGKSMGELEVRGPWVAGSYFQTDEGKDKWTEDGWFRTGDVVTIDEHGYMHIADRTKDLIKSGGEWISSVALENLLMAHPAVAEAAAIAIPDPKWGERPLAVVVFHEGKSATPEELREHLAPHFAKWALPDAFVVRDAIPRTSTGKFLKRALRDEYKDFDNG
ncbi:MAG: long-chain fatty acid--CoA ligase [Myxococcota bacterium]